MAVKLTGPANHGGFSFRGESFAPDENGQVDVPHEALDEAFSHGFTYPTEETEQEDQGGEPKAAKKKK